MRNSKEKTAGQNRRKLLDRNSIVFALSLLIAVILWIGVSMFQTTEVDKTFQNIRVRVPFEGSLPANNGLQIFGDADFTVDVTVSGKSYVLNDDNFAGQLDATVSLSSVREAGTYTLPVTVTCALADVEITNVTKTAVSIYFDETVERDYEITEDIVEADGYLLPEGYTAENPRLSADHVTLVGPSLEIGKISSVLARVELDKEVTGTETFQAELVYLGNNSMRLYDAQIPNVTLKDAEPVTVTIPVNITTTLKPTVDFTGAPSYYRNHDVEYTAAPDMLNVTIPANDSETFNAKEIKVGTIDFSEIDNTLEVFTFMLDGQDYTFRDDVDRVRVWVDMSGMAKRWLTIGINADGVKLPDGAEILTDQISSVQVIGPEESVMATTLGNDEAYAVPVVDDFEWQPGVNTVPVRIHLRTLKDSWVYGSYSIEVRIPE